MSRRLREAELRLMSMGVRANKEVDYLFQHIEELQAKVDELEKDKEFFRRNLVKAKADEVILRSENQRYKQALEFYADEDNYKPDAISQWEPVVPVIDDNGKQARQALKGVEG